MLRPEQVEQFHREGFVLGGEVLTEDEVETLRSELERVIAQDGADGPQPVLLRNLAGDPGAPVWQIVNIWEASEAFRALLTNARVVQALVQLTQASELRVWHDQVQYKPAAKGGVNMWHQDSPYWPILTPKTSQLTAWIALDDVDESNGCMSMVPGSHRWGNQVDFLHTLENFDSMPPRFEGHAIDVVRCPVRKGYVHFHHALAWHASHANRSGRPRRAIAIHYMTGETRYDASGDHVMKRFVEVPDGAKLTGSHFPQVYSA